MIKVHVMDDRELNNWISSLFYYDKNRMVNLEPNPGRIDIDGTPHVLVATSAAVVVIQHSAAETMPLARWAWSVPVCENVLESPAKIVQEYSLLALQTWVGPPTISGNPAADRRMCWIFDGGFDANLIAHVLSGLKGEKVAVEYRGPASPVVFRTGNWLVLVAPCDNEEIVKIDAEGMHGSYGEVFQRPIQGYPMGIQELKAAILRDIFRTARNLIPRIESAPPSLG